MILVKTGFKVNFLVHLQNFAGKIFSTSKLVIFPFEMLEIEGPEGLLKKEIIFDIPVCNKNNSSKTTRYNNNMQIDMCGTEPWYNTAGYWALLSSSSTVLFASDVIRTFLLAFKQLFHG